MFASDVTASTGDTACDAFDQGALAYAQLSDASLLQRIGQKDTAAYEILYNRHADRIFSLILRIVRNRSVAEELLQDVFWQVWQTAHQFAGRGSGAAWLYRIARNRSLDQLRRQRARPQLVEMQLDVWAHRVHPCQQSAEFEAERLWDCENVRRALDRIPQEQRLCLELAYFDGLSCREIAEQTDVRLGTIKSRMRSGLQKLEWLLQTAGY